jgi:hypothetical protein
LVGKTEEQRQIRKLRSRCEDNIKIYTEFMWLSIGTGGGLL